MLLQTNPSLKILDVGAGTASIPASFAKIIGPSGGRITALDINPAVLERGRNNLTSKYGLSEEEAGWIDFRVGDGHALPFGEGVFDVVVCHQVLAHNREQVGVLREMLRVVKEGGVVAAREGDTETECFWPELGGLLKFRDK